MRTNSFEILDFGFCKWYSDSIKWKECTKT